MDRPLLALVSDGFGLLATVVEDQQGEIRFVASARSSLADPETSLMEVAGKLAVSYGKLPREAIMLHAHAIPSILELAIENVDSLEKSKLQELVRWEMESIFGDLVPHDNLGWLMIGLGFINEKQRDALVKALEEENAAAQKKRRIGEVAIEHGYINRNQLEECLKVQDQLQLQDQRIRCGWNAVKPSSQVRWLATAVSDAIHQKWVDAFRMVTSRASIGRTRLKAFYPFIGTCAMQFPDVYGREEVYILELHRPYLVLLRYLNGHMTMCLTLECSSDTPKLNDIETLINNAEVPEDSEIHVLVSHMERLGLRESLKSLPGFSFKQLDREVPLSANLSGDIATAEAIMISGATVDYITRNHQLIVPVEGQEPPPPVYQRPAAKIAAAMLAVCCLIAGIEVTMAWRAEKTHAKLEDITEKVRRQELVKKDLRASQDAQQKLDALNSRYKNLIATKKLMESVLVTRQQFMDKFLDMVTNNLNDHILIDSIKEQSWNKFVIQGWAMDQPSIDYFSHGLARDLKKWDMAVTDNPSSLGRNNSGYSGYTFKFVIEKINPSRIVTSMSQPGGVN